MKILNKAPRLLIFALLATSLSACSSTPAEPDGLADARREVQRVYPDAGIPNIEGVELSLAYKDKSFSLPDELKSDEADPMDKDSIVLVYSREKGKLKSEDTLPEELLYGPYEGDQTLLLTLSERPATVQGSEARVVEGTEIQVAKLQNHTIYATARPNDVTYTLQASTDSGFEEDELLGILSQVSTSQEN
ncbi:hypothetical protein [Saccharibacillus endophyticus]|uniref:DUF4367 domain-containing protein n=1 Tax=Saccharibacillus endophyticus TaxID=2060666 RepID=A0ABQ1ZS41_9BACL|nr:hypothetical protein [Saccharibacillus endophyticus]GGH74845.1 hypothetical protein GCM10007362_15350 [Saccharibacillus endophyticus]